VTTILTVDSPENQLTKFHPSTVKWLLKIHNLTMHRLILMIHKLC